MNHKPYEDWVLDPTSLEQARKQELEQHLKDCASCSSLLEVEQLLRSPKLRSPQPGFSNRFQVRLEAERKLRRVRSLQGMVFLVLSAVILLGLAGIWFMSSNWVNPITVFIGWLTWWLNLLASIQAIGSVGFVLIKVIGTFIPLPAWIALLTAGCLLVLGWVMTLWKLSYSKFAGRLA